MSDVTDPITLATIVTTLIETKAIEKIGERGIQEGGKLVNALRRKAPATVKRLESVTDPNVIDADIVEEVRKVAAAEPEVQAAVTATVSALEQQPGSIVNFEKMIVANTGFVQTQNNSYTL